MSKAPTIHPAFVACTNYVRDALGRADVGSFVLTIKASGRTMTDRNEVKIEYRVADNTWDGNAVTGNSLDAVVVELLRRHGWNETHQPLALPEPKVVSLVEDDA